MTTIMIQTLHLRQDGSSEPLVPTELAPLGKCSFHVYSDHKIAATDAFKVVNLDGIGFPVRLHNIAASLYPEDAARRRNYGRAALRSLALSHLLWHSKADIVISLAAPLPLTTLATALSDVESGAYPYREIRARDVEAESSFVLDCRRPETQAAAHSTFRLYEDGTVGAFAVVDFQYALAASYAAAQRQDPADLPLLAETMARATWSDRDNSDSMPPILR